MQYQQLHYQEIGLSRVATLYYNSKIDQKKTVPKSAEDFQVFGQILEKLYKAPDFSVDAANVLKKLMQTRLMPTWLLPMIDFSQVDRYADGSEVPEPKCYACYSPSLDTGVAVICPQLEGDRLISPFAAIGRGMVGPHQLYILGLRSRVVCTIEIAPEQSGQVLMGDVEFKVI